MNKQQKIGWLVLGLAILFMLWRLPRLHGQGFGSFSHDQPFLAKDAAASTSIPWPPTAQLAAWWHWEDVTVSGTNWVDRVNGNTWISSGTSTPTNDGTGLYFDGIDDVMTNLTFVGNFDTLWYRGIGVYVIASTKGRTNASYLFCSGGANPKIMGLADTGSRQTCTNFFEKAGLGGNQTVASNIITGDLFGLGYSLQGNFDALDVYLNGVNERTVGNVYEWADDQHHLGNKYDGTKGWYGWVYDILVYTNVYRWTTNTTPAIADIYQWQTNWYNRAVTLASPTNIPNFYPVVWYVGDDGLTTNASVVSWADRSLQSKPLTNAGATGTWPSFTNAALNGHALISFDGVDDWISSELVSNTTPTEYFMVLSHDGNAVGGYNTIFDAYYSDGTFAENLFFFETSESKLGLFSGGAVARQFIVWTNQWWLVDAVFNHAQSTIYTNGTTFMPRTYSGAASMAGLYLAGNRTATTVNSRIRVAEFIMYPNVLQPRYRTALTQQLKTKYGL